LHRTSHPSASPSASSNLATIDPISAGTRPSEQALKLRFTDRSKYKEPDEVAAATERALFEASPKRRYLVVPEGREAEITIRKQIEQLVQLNEGQPYTYDRTALIKMLDDALAQARPRTQ